MSEPDPTVRASGRALRDAPATHRNREPILEELARWLPASARVLEIASGTGQHAVFFAERLPGTRVMRLDDCGHLAHEEAPARIVELISAACPTDRGADADG